MTTVATETARILTPLTTIISAMLMKLSAALYDVYVEFSGERNRELERIAHALKSEYPFEPHDYLVIMAERMQSGKSNA